MAQAAKTKKNTRSAKKAPKNAITKVADNVHSFSEKFRKGLSGRMEDSSHVARARTAEFAIMLIKFQRSAFDGVFKVLTKLQKRSDKLIKKHVETGDWLPAEGKDIISEWNRALNDGRIEFQKTADKSYDLLCSFFERMADEKEGPAKKESAATGSAKKKPVAKSAAA